MKLDFVDGLDVISGVGEGEGEREGELGTYPVNGIFDVSIRFMSGWLS